jgi:uroporphyrinogen-III synthase
MKVKTILVSQPEPKMENSPYQNLVDRTKVKIDFRSFIHVEGAAAKEVREQKIDLSKFTAIILTSRNAVDHFFRVADEMRFKIPDSLKYFCQSEAVAYYLQKYVVYRKRKIYETFLIPSSDKVGGSSDAELDKLGVKWKSGVFFRTVISDLSDLADVKYDVLVFFSPSGIESLFKNFPEFTQEQTRIAVFGNTTMKAAQDKGLRIDIQAPTPESPSMTMAIENYIKDKA